MATASDTLPRVPSQPSRRVVLGTMAAVPMAAVPMAAAGAVPGLVLDPHLEWWQRHERLAAEIGALPDDDDVRQPFLDQLWGLEDLIAQTPAATMAGLRLQAMVGLMYVEKETASDLVPPLEVRALRSIRVACDRLAAA